MEALPQQIGRFRIEGLLGRGAMGVVYKAHDPHIDRVVAIKLVRADLLSGESRGHYLARFHNEARLAGRCIHRNIVGIHDFSEHEGNPFLVLEYVNGRDLGRAVPRGTQAPLAQATSIALETLAALGYAHALGVIHRDIKPANILLSAESGLKVTDFGISRAMSAEATMSSVLVGTPCYMSPEQCLGAEVDARSDLFSLGCVFYELLSGRRAFAASNYVATMHALIHDTPPSLHTLRDGLPNALVRLVERAIEKRPADRFGDAAEMAAAIRSVLGARREAAGDDDETIVMEQGSGAAGTGLLDAGSRSPASSSGAGSAGLAGSRLEPAPPGSATDGSPPSASLNRIERRLAHHVGPMARYQLRRAVATAGSPEELCAQLADNLPDQTLRARFILEIEALLAQDTTLPLSLRGSPPPAPPAQPAPLDDEAIERIRLALARVVGPVASRLINRVRSSADDLPSLLQACAGMIDGAQDRERFLAGFADSAASRTPRS